MCRACVSALSRCASLLPDLGCTEHRACPVSCQPAPVMLLPWFVFFQDCTGDRREKGSSSDAASALLGLCPAGGGVFKPLLLRTFLRIRCLSQCGVPHPKLCRTGLACLHFGNFSAWRVRVTLYRFTQKCAECFLAESCVGYREAFLSCLEIVVSVLPGGRARTDGICLCPTSPLCFEPGSLLEQCFVAQSRTFEFGDSL